MTRSISTKSVFTVLVLLCPHAAYSQMDKSQLKSLVQGYRDTYINSLDNVRCKVEGVDSHGIQYSGNIAILNGVQPFLPFPRRGAVLMRRSPAWQSSSPEGDREGLKVSNSQYSFNLTRLPGGSQYAANDVLVQLDNLSKMGYKQRNCEFRYHLHR